ncbi:DinB family protein [Flagellimonas flava]|uniref:DinB family protein n=1 Tax=Flagellimonas flava TaxID=570519 RepID=UPI003D64CCDA
MTSSRRKFLTNSALVTAGFTLTPGSSFASSKAEKSTKNDLYLIGPKDGYTPEIGTLLSTMTMMRHWVINTVKDLTMEQLDYQIDDQSNSIGAMLLHLAATERYYQLNTFDEMEWGSWSDEIKKEWDVPMSMGQEGRKKIKGNTIDFYLSKLEEVRDKTHQELARRDDAWLEKVEPFFQNKPTNNYCKWFHVCEHESNHRGQMKFIIKRLPSA